jgi:predicted nucleic acid-binding protein
VIFGADDMKYIFFDSSSIISLTQTNMLFLLEKLKSKEIKFCISKAVYDEIILPGQENYQFGWSSEQIEACIDSGLIEVLELETKEQVDYDKIDELVNSIFSTKFGPIQILQKGELETIILLKRFKEKKLFSIDELITREIIDDPKKLKDIVERRYKTQLFLDEKKLKQFVDYVFDIKVIRSVDLAAYSFGKNQFEKYGPKNKHLLKSVLYALKDSGCAVLQDEIEKYAVEHH